MNNGDLQTFRDMAKKSRQTAAIMSDPHIEAALLRIATEFDGIGDRVEHLLKRPH
jgi:hypothetical protein